MSRTADRTIRVTAAAQSMGDISKIALGKPMVIPAAGIGHKGNPGETFQVVGCQDILVQDVSIYSAPFFTGRFVVTKAR